MDSSELITWLTTELHDIENFMVFDRILEINDRILDYLNKNNLKLKTEYKLFLLRVIILLKNNSL